MLLGGVLATTAALAGPGPDLIVPLQGVLELDTQKQHLAIEVIEDRYGIAADPRWRLDQLPAFRLAFVTQGDEILPLQSGPLPSEHPYWEWLPGPGRAWRELGDKGWMQAEVTVTLRERHQNCTHNGLLRFAYSADGRITPVRFELSGETCLYLKINLSGTLPARYEPGRPEGAEERIAARQALRAARLPQQSVSALAARTGLDAAALVPPDEENVSVYGYVVDGVHYRSDCATRNGPYPLCAELQLPSYSTAKALFAGLVFDYLAERDPGFADTPVTALVPECQLPDQRWDGVRLRHLADMSTGLFDSEAFEADEGAPRMIEQFFIPTANAQRIQFACTAWPKKAPPTTRQAYHTSDTWLLGVAMNRYLKARRGQDADIHRDVLLGEIFEPLTLSPATTHSLRSSDADAQPYAGFGLTFTPDDAARLGLYLASRTPDFNAVPDWPAARGERYHNGVWAVDAAEITGCPGPLWIPFLSGYGGITIAMLPHGSLFYVFGDGNTFRWLRTAAQLHTIQPWCEDAPQ